MKKITRTIADCYIYDIYKKDGDNLLFVETLKAERELTPSELNTLSEEKEKEFGCMSFIVLKDVQYSIYCMDLADFKKNAQKVEGKKGE